MRNQPSPPAATPEGRELDSFNAAFDELGFEWRWDAATMAELAPIGDDRQRVRAYVERHHPHLLRVYDADFLGELVVDTKRRQARPELSLAHAAMQHRAYA